jgi:hypothetical protein
MYITSHLESAKQIFENFTKIMNSSFKPYNKHEIEKKNICITHIHLKQLMPNAYIE